MSSMSGDFFRDVFGFSEGEYVETRRLLEFHARFKQDDDLATFGAPAEHCEFVDLPSPTKTSSTTEPSDRTTTTTAAGSAVVDAGVFSTPSVQELRDQAVKDFSTFRTQHPDVLESLQKEYHPSREGHAIRIVNVKGEARGLHHDAANLNATIQAASQFNYLEFPGPGVTPERGISGYIFDRTQGPACAIACAAGTAYRNYLVRMPGRVLRGQTHDAQLNGMADVEQRLRDAVEADPSFAPLPSTVPSVAVDHSGDVASTVGQQSSGSSFFKVRNGYVESTMVDLKRLNALIAAKPSLVAELESRLRIGVQADTAVTDPQAGKTYVRDAATGKWTWASPPPSASGASSSVFRVTQTYNSALSVGYSRVQGGDIWGPMARLVLRATYEATLLAGAINTMRHAKARPPGTLIGRLPPVLLTKVGGGVFGNDAFWIRDAIREGADRVGRLCPGLPLDVRIVHYGGVEDGYEEAFPE